LNRISVSWQTQKLEVESWTTKEEEMREPTLYLKEKAKRGGDTYDADAD